MNEAEIILISGRYGVRSDSQKLAEGLAILWLLQQLDQKMPKLHEVEAEMKQDFEN